ncbi:acyl carrier protein [Nannocystis pusilla]|uniref:Acyl carrier protein n=1 Tax=Nannocystis pusilla TaxID=889268 RepID=A0ABS7U5F0_9BACT|nr:acyl carrier protein [Nannocystis pusilla]MBZ5715798.1 acyl carrier protein [Nannocystis pusilla]
MDGIIDNDLIVARVRALIADAVRQPVAAIPLDVRVDGSELGIDSLGLIKLTVRIEETFDITMPDLAAPGAGPLGSVREVAALVAEQVAARQAGGAR